MNAPRLLLLALLPVLGGCTTYLAARGRVVERVEPVPPLEERVERDPIAVDRGALPHIRLLDPGGVTVYQRGRADLVRRVYATGESPFKKPHRAIWGSVGSLWFFSGQVMPVGLLLWAVAIPYTFAIAPVASLLCALDVPVALPVYFKRLRSERRPATWHAVFRRAGQRPGRPLAGERVTVTLGGRSLSTQTDEQGRLDLRSLGLPSSLLEDRAGVQLTFSLGARSAQLKLAPEDLRAILSR